MIPSAEKIASDYLRDHADIVALGARVVGKTPSDTADPWIRVSLIDARNESGSKTDYQLSHYLQLDCYAGADGGQPEASTLTRTARTVLHGMPDASIAGVEVTQVTFAGMARVPDTDVDEPARERYVLTAVVRGHEVL